MKNKFLAIISASIMFSSILTSSSVFASTNSPVNVTISDTDTNALNVQKIKELYLQKSTLLTQEPVDQTKIDEVNEKLKSHGVEFLTVEQVKAKTTNSVEELSGVQPLAAIPSQSNIEWSSYRDTVSRQGVNYEVQHLIAQPNGKSSNLKELVQPRLDGLWLGEQQWLS